METISLIEHREVVAQKNKQIQSLFKEMGDPMIFDVCGDKIHVITDNIAQESFFERLSEKSKEWSGLNHFIDAIEKL